MVLHGCIVTTIHSHEDYLMTFQYHEGGLMFSDDETYYPEGWYVYFEEGFTFLGG